MCAFQDTGGATEIRRKAGTVERIDQKVCCLLQNKDSYVRLFLTQCLFSFSFTYSKKMNSRHKSK